MLANPKTTGRFRITPFKATDGPQLYPDSARMQALASHINFDEACRTYENKGPGWTLWVDDTIVGCAGLLFFPWPGVAEAWLMPTNDLPKYPKTVVLSVIAHLRDLIAQYGLWRVQCTVEKGYVIGRRFVEALGFQPEAELKYYGPNHSTHILYAWLKADA